MDEVQVLIILNSGILISILGIGFKIIRFINRLEFKTDLMWVDYVQRMKISNSIAITDSDND